MLIDKIQKAYVFVFIAIDSIFKTIIECRITSYNNSKTIYILFLLDSLEKYQSWWLDAQCFISDLGIHSSHYS